jgi:hypothetical protein
LWERRRRRGNVAPRRRRTTTRPRVSAMLIARVGREGGCARRRGTRPGMRRIPSERGNL